MAGPAMAVTFIAAVPRDIAFISLPWGTTCEIIAWRLGIFSAISEPLHSPRMMRCQSWTIPIMSSPARTRVKEALPACEMMTRCLLGIRSASAPAIRETKVNGAAKDTIVQVSARGESLVISRTSQARVVICMFMDMNDAQAPSHSHLKSRY